MTAFSLNSSWLCSRILFSFSCSSMVEWRVLQVEALLDFLHRLLHGVAHFGQVDLGYDVKTVIGHVFSESA